MLAEGRVEADTVLAGVASIFLTHGGTVDSLPREPWTFAELVGWWLRAAEATDKWDAVASDQLAGLLRCANGRQHPVVWCHERRQRLRLQSEHFDADLRGKGRTWFAAGFRFDDYLGKLFRWATNCDRTGMPRPGPQANAWIDEYQEAFAMIEDDYACLFSGGQPPKPAGPLSWATRHDWAPRWVTSPVRGRLSHELRRPIVGDKGGARRVLFKGVTVATLPVAVIAQLTQRSRATEAEPLFAGGLVRAASAAASHCRDGTLLSRALTDATGGGTGSLSAAAVDRLLLPVARCLVAGIETIGDREPGTASVAETGAWEFLGQHLAISLALDGFDLRSGDAPADGGGRMIPSRFRAGNGPQGVALVHAATCIDVPLGWFGEPATCEERLLEAIDALDWRLWAYQYAPWSKEDAAGAQLARIVMDAARQAEWEALKRQSLRLETDADVLARLYRHAHERGLTMRFLRDRAYGNTDGDPMLKGLIEEYASLGRTTLGLLVAVDPSATSRLDPPRRADGSVDVAGWVSGRGSGEPAAAEWRLEWVRDERPAAAVMDERRTNTGYVITVSAGTIPEPDLALLRLAAMPPAPRQRGVDDFLPETLSSFQAALATLCLVSSRDPHDGSACAALRDAFAGPRAPAFHELIARWRQWDEEAAAWVTALAGDPRVGFACHPRVDGQSKAVATAEPDDTFLEWDFHSDVPKGGDVAITFAIDAAQARRVISRGPRGSGSAADLVDGVVKAAGTSGPLSGPAAECRLATDRWLHFSDAAPHPAGAACRLLDAVLGKAEVPADVRLAVFQKSVLWCAALEHAVVPATWCPERPIAVEALPQTELSHLFMGNEPAGSIVIQAFGLQGPSGRTFAGSISAGPAPPGFAGLEEAVTALAARLPFWATIVQRVAELAKHSTAGTLPLCGANLFDAIWEAAAGDVPADSRVFVDDAKASLLELLKAACHMTTFEPSSVGDYPTGWTRESDGKQPQHRRVRCVIRPGLRTLENRLVRPAIVVTE